jgi:hypothetical protein
MGIKNEEFEANFESAKNGKIIYAKKVINNKVMAKCRFWLLLLCANAYTFFGASILAIFQRIQNQHKILRL